MSNTAFQTQYREEFIYGFEQRESLLRAATTTEIELKGNTAVFLVANSGSASAVTRGVNGLIPAREDSLTQNSCTLQEWHDLVEKTGFNIFASQSNQKAIMQQTSMAVVNRKVDQDIIGELSNTTNFAGTQAVAGSIDLVVRARTILGNNFVPIWEEDNMFFLATPAMMGYMLQIPEFASSLYVDVKPLARETGRQYRRWGGFNWIEHPNLPGVGTSSETCFAFHRSGIGHAVNKGEIMSEVDYDRKQDASWARTSVYMGSKLLQAAGVVGVRHDASRYAATA